MSFLERGVLIAWLALAGAGAASADPPRDPRFQKPIQDAVEAVVRQDQDAAGARVEELRQLGSGHRDALLLQFALYLERSTGTEQSMGGAVVLQELAF